MPLLMLFLTSFGIGFSGALMPGPLLTVDIAESTRRGFWTGPILVLGHAIAELAVVIALAVGLLKFMNSDLAFKVIGLVGGLALIIMGGMMFYDILRNRLTLDDSKPASGSGLLIGKGITTSLSNPYWFVWWATVGSALLTKSLSHGFVGPAVFYIGHILSDLVWYSLVSFLISIGKKFLVGKPYIILISLCALFLLFIGATFIIDALK
ncbi:MAG: LysE family transporter [candidate division Zixibacteria bacterium]|nr:LysE family transporter [candidate division Zixibacteria bacterium]